jgi:hypothetical protein
MYRKIFVVEPGHDMSALIPHAEEGVVFIFTGYETSVAQLSEAAIRNLSDFNSETDAFVPTGKMRDVTFASMRLKELNGGKITVGIYKDKDYTFERM